MIVNRQTLIELAPIKFMSEFKTHYAGVTHGMSEAGYDIRIKQEIRFTKDSIGRMVTVYVENNGRMIHDSRYNGRFVLASTVEEFDMPTNLVGVVHDKSTWARRGLSVFNTVIEPGWKGFLTLELVYHGEEDLIIPAGSGIAQVVFHFTTDPAQYSGRYQDQANAPVPAKSTS